MNSGTRAGWRAAVLAMASLACAFFAPLARAEDPSAQRSMAEQLAPKYGISVDAAVNMLDSQDRLNDAMPAISAAAGDASAGNWFDKRTPDRLTVGISAQADDATVARVEAAIKESGLESDIDIARVPYSWGQLRAAHDAIDERLADLLKRGSVVRTSINTPMNSVEIALVPNASDADEATARAAADASDVNVQVVREETAGEPSLLSCASRTPGDGLEFCDNPLRGSVAIGTHDVGCTSGFVTLGNSGGSPWLLTAGHCLSGDGNAQWSSRDSGLTVHPIGYRHTFTYPDGSGDYGIMSMTGGYWSTSPYVIYDGTLTRNETYHIYDVGTSSVGLAICNTGSRPIAVGSYRGYMDCGSVTGVDATHLGTHHLGYSDNMCTVFDGNSGAPVFKDGHGYGITSSGDLGTCHYYYQGLAAALSGSNVHLPG